MLIKTLAFVAAAGCAAQDIDEQAEPVFAGATCGNGFFDDPELCVANPGPIVLATGSQVRTVLGADVNADGVRDIVAVTQTRAWVRYGAAGGGFGAWMSLSTAGADYRDIATGDFDFDGDLDLAVADAGTDRVIVWRNNGGALFPLWQTIAVGDEPIRILAERLDGDARPDLAVLAAGADEIDIIRATGAPFAFAIPYAAGDAGDIALGDCNVDGRRDLLYVNGMGAGTVLRARRNDGLANFGVPLVSPLPLVDPAFGPLAPFVLASGDFDADGAADAVVSASWSRLGPATSNGNCTFTPAPLGITWAWVRTRLRVVDWNADGDLDLGAPHGVLGGAGAEVYSIAYGDGTGAFPTYQMEPHPADTVIPRDLAFFDANADGHVDVLVAGDTGVYLERRIP